MKKDFYSIYVSVNGKEVETKYYTQIGRISKYCNKMYEKYGEGTKIKVYRNDDLWQTWSE